MIAMLTPSNHWPCRWCSWWLFSIIVVAVDVRTVWWIVCAFFCVCADLLVVPLMLVLVFSCCGSCRWCSCWLHSNHHYCLLPLMLVLILPSWRIVDDFHTDSVTSLPLSLMLVIPLWHHSCRNWCPYWFLRRLVIITRAVDARVDFTVL